MKITESHIWRACFSRCGGHGSEETNPTNGAQTSIGGRLRHLLVSEEEGTQLVELAFVAPIFLILLTGLASFSMALYSFQQLGYATSAAAQSVGAQQGLIGDPCSQIASDVTSSLSGWSAGNFTYTVVITDSSSATHTYGPTAGSSFSCTAGASEWAQNYPMTVKVSYAYTWFGILAWKPNSTFAPSGNLTVSEAVMVE